MTFSAIKSRAKEALVGRRRSSIGGWLLYFALVLATSLVFGILGGFLGFLAPYEATVILAQQLSSIGSFVIFAPIVAGLYWLHLDIFDKKDVAAGNIFQGFSHFGKTLGITFLIALFTSLWSILLIIPGIIKGLAYSQAIFILRDEPQIGILEAITKSRQLMDGAKWRYFFFSLSFLGWWLPLLILPFVLAFTTFISHIVLLVFLCLYLIFLFFYFVPYYQTALAGFYRSLNPKEEK